MPQGGRGGRRAALLGAALCALAAAQGPAGRAEAQTKEQSGTRVESRQSGRAGDEVRPSRQAQAEQRYRFDIPTRPLAQAITDFSATTGLQVLYTETETFRRQAPALSGSLTAAQALDRLLVGSGLVWRFTEAGSVTLEKPDDEGALRLGPVTVEGRRESAWAPVQGYVAKQEMTGTKTDTPIIETPQSISVVTADQIETTNATSLAEALAYTPGFNAQSAAFSRMVDDFMLRGFNVATGDSGMLRDGMKLQSNVYDGNQEPYGLERVEVLRGPASILYGQVAPGGVVNAVSKRPTAEPYHEIQTQFGSNERKQFAGDLGGPLTEDGQLRYRLTGLLRDGNTWIDEVQDDRRYIAPALTWAPSPETSLTLLASYQEIDTKFSAPLPADYTLNGQIPRDWFLGEPDFDRYETSTYTAGYAFEQALDDRFTLRSNLRYFHSDIQWDYLGFGSLAADGRTVSRAISVRSETSTGFTADNSLVADLSTGPLDHRLLAGVDFYRSTYRRDRILQGSAAPIDLYDPVYGSLPTIPETALDFGTDNSGRQVGLYLQDQVSWGDHWHFLFGGRQDWAHSESESHLDGSKTEQDDSAFSGRLGLVYETDSGIAPYLSFSQSFAQVGGSGRSGEPFEPTRGEQYEAGIRYQPAGERLLLSAAVYHLTQSNVLTADPVDPTFSVQEGEVVSKGVELEARLDLGALGLIASYAFTDAETTESNDPARVGEQVDLVPRHKFAVWADYDLDGFGIEGLTLGAGLRVSSAQNISGYDEDVPAQALVDAMARYRMGALDPALEGMEVKVNAENLFDKEYVTCTTGFGCRYGAPLGVYATISYRW